MVGAMAGSTFSTGFRLLFPDTKIAAVCPIIACCFILMPVSRLAPRHRTGACVLTAPFCRHLLIAQQNPLSKLS